VVCTSLRTAGDAEESEAGFVRALDATSFETTGSFALGLAETTLSCMTAVMEGDEEVRCGYCCAAAAAAAAATSAAASAFVAAAAAATSRPPLLRRPS
jgi:hypothetical protein